MKLSIASVCLLSAAIPASALTVAPVPEPSTIAMVALGGAAGLFLAWRKRRSLKR